MALCKEKHDVWMSSNMQIYASYRTLRDKSSILDA